MHATAAPPPPPTDQRDFHGRLGEAVSLATGRPGAPCDVLRRVPSTDPTALTDALATLLPGRFALTGTLDRRLLLAEANPGRNEWVAADLSGQPHQERDWPAWTRDRITLADPATWLTTAVLTDEAVTRLQRPRVLLTALYHPEWFPLPRFPLGISDLARAARGALLGQVRLMDMQLGATAADVLTAVRDWAPDIVGISATFGQHDLMVELLDAIYAQPEPPLVLAGGSLTARNEALLLDRYPRLLVARGAGEPTIADAVAYFHHDLDLGDIRGIGYHGARPGQRMLSIGHRRTAATSNRAQSDYLPELDLLDATFASNGVAQLEASRGCTNFCSFCPRGHKGTWSSGDPADLGWFLAELRGVFDRHPSISRTLYLVDEEVIGGAPDAVARIRALAATLRAAGFRWESSCRVDQVVDPGRDRIWHLERADMWRHLVDDGLRRMLFGVESGVTSILTRFNKETTAEQNALAIRTLSALGVPTRFTYITFDQLMDFDEVRASHAFQGRTDLLLRPLPQLSVAEVVDGVRDPRFVAAHSTGRPFYSGISYMLVSMECLTGAAYTRRVQAAGLAGEPDPTMGRVAARFADWRIGRCSYHAQMWIDRNFALDYTLKSLEKILDGPPRQITRAARVVIKDAAYALLTAMLGLIERAAAGWDAHRLDAALAAALDHHLAALTARMDATVAGLLPHLASDPATVLAAEHADWRTPRPWRLINSTDPCGT